MNVPRDLGNWVRRAAALGPRGIWTRLRERVDRRAENNRGRRAAAQERETGRLELAYAQSLMENCQPQEVAQLMRATIAERFLYSPAQRDARLAALHRVSPHARERIVAEANQLLSHQFDLLGSGPQELGTNIDWHSDFKSGHRWDPETYYRDIAIAPSPGGYDIKVPWELSRFQHLVRLGQAWWLTGRAAYADEVAAQICAWIAANPAGLGVNWACAMDVGLRAVSWWMAMGFIVDAPAASDEFLSLAARSLWQHGRHIAANLEGSPKKRTNSNHYLANLLALAYLGQLMPWQRAAAEWRCLAISELWRELEVQVGDDGVDYEGSTAYHRLVSEFYVAALLLAHRGGIEVPAAAADHVAGMIGAIDSLARPDGGTPHVGDQDNGRAWRFGSWADAAREWEDYRPLAALARCVLANEDHASDGAERLEEAVWLAPIERVAGLGAASTAAEPSIIRPSCAFARARWFVLRHGEVYLLVTGGGSSTGGLGNHSHGDLLSFELAVGQDRLIVDPGAGCYTADYDLRNRLRAAKAHNTLVMDEREQGQLNPAQLFSFPGKPAAQVIEAQLAGPAQLLAMQYQLADCDWTHRRTFHLDADRCRLSIIDELYGVGMHAIAGRFCFWPDVRLDRSAQSVHVEAVGRDVCWEWSANLPDFECQLEAYPYSPSYGNWEDRMSLQYAGRAALPFRCEYFIQWRRKESEER